MRGPMKPIPSVGSMCEVNHLHANRTEPTHIEMTIRNVSLGGSCKLEVEDSVAANDDITIRVVTSTWESEVSVGREDVPKLIAALEMHMSVRENG